MILYLEKSRQLGVIMLGSCSCVRFICFKSRVRSHECNKLVSPHKRV